MNIKNKSRREQRLLKTIKKIMDEYEQDMIEGMEDLVDYYND